MDHDTDIGGSQHRFPVTRNSAIVAARSDDHEVRRRGLETIVESYWKPAYKYLRIKWQASNEDAKDLVQGFFARAIEKDYFVSYDPTKASFQTFLRTCLDRFVTNQKKEQQRLKRGGGVDLFSLDFTAAEAELVLHQAGFMRPRDLNAKISKAAEAVCLKAMDQSRRKRYASASELSAEVARLLDDEPVTAYRENAFEKSKRWLGKNRFFVFLVLTYLLMRIFFILTARR